MRGYKIAVLRGWASGRLLHSLARPGDLQGGRDVAALTEVQDLLPTLIDLCGLKTPPDAHFDGTSLAGLLKGTSRQACRPDAGGAISARRRPKATPRVLWNKWRLVKDTELYDVATDPGQKKDVAAEHPDVVKRMQDHYDAWWAGVEPNVVRFQCR